tara:strand:+ start:11648 stop:12145 length:498 start_codon:yes stop_codon:yes gene_type:complete
MIVLGVDPGNTGALCFLCSENGPLGVIDMPVVPVKVGRSVKNRLSPAMLSALIEDFPFAPDCAFVEEVHAMPKQGVSSSFYFGASYGTILGILAARKTPTQTITPQKWRKLIGVRGGKGASRALAAQLQPKLAGQFARAKDDGRAESCLIAMAGLSLMRLSEREQ